MPPPLEGGKQNTPKDFFAGRITLRKGLTGSKSREFCAWVLSLLNVQRGDTMDDLFPGVGGMASAIAEAG